MTPRSAEEIAREIDDALDALNRTVAEFVAACPRCDGKGFRHDFGEHGHDPDWCYYCGGSGVQFKNEAYQQRRLEVIAAAIEKDRAEAAERHGRTYHTICRVDDKTCTDGEDRMMAYLIEQFLDVREALEAERNKSTPSVRQLEWLEERYERTKAAIDSAFEELAVKIKEELRRDER